MKNVCEAWSKAKPPDYKGISPTTATMITGSIAPEIQSVASTFKDLQEARHEADYELAVTFNRIDVLALVTRVDQAFKDWQVVRGTRNANVFLTALLFEKLRKAR